MTAAVKSCDRGLSRADIRKEKVLDTARKLFIENGFHATGIAQVAKQSGIAVGQIYRDFCSKEAIVAALVNADCTKFLQTETLQRAINTGDTKEVLAWVLRFIEGDGDLDASRLFAEVIAESSRNRRIASIFTVLQQDLRRNLSSAIEMLAPALSEDGQSSALADVVVTMSLGILQHRLILPPGEVTPIAETLGAIIQERLDTLRWEHRPKEPF